MGQPTHSAAHAFHPLPTSRQPCTGRPRSGADLDFAFRCNLNSRVMTILTFQLYRLSKGSQRRRISNAFSTSQCRSQAISTDAWRIRWLPLAIVPWSHFQSADNVQVEFVADLQPRVRADRLRGVDRYRCPRAGRCQRASIAAPAHFVAL